MYVFNKGHLCDNWKELEFVVLRKTSHSRLYFSHGTLIVFGSTAACSIWHFQCGSAHKFRAKLADFSIDIDALEKHAYFFVSQGLSTLGNLSIDTPNKDTSLYLF